MIGLEKFVLIANNKKKINIADKIVSDCCEALIGAIFLDKGLEAVEKFILKFWKDDLKASIITFVDAKTKLQEFSLKKFKTLPIYKVLENTGPRHKPIFKVAVRLEDSKFVAATGNSKKEAEQMAASSFLKNVDL